MKKVCLRAFGSAVFQYLTPQVFKQAYQASPCKYSPPRWPLSRLLWVLLTSVWCSGDSQEERFVAARAAYVSCHQSTRRPGKTLAGFLMALAKVPMVVLRAVSAGVRRQLGNQFLEPLRINGFLPIACDGSRLECPRSEELQRRLGESGKAGSAPMMYLTTLVLLPLGLVWSWRWGKGTANEHDHLRQLLPTLPPRSLIVADAFFAGYELFRAILQARASFLVRMSSRFYLYTAKKIPLQRFREGIVYYWPKAERDRGNPPIKLRLIRIRGKKADVWLLTNILDPKQLSRKIAGQLYRWRWRNEGMFRHYKRMLKKVKLESRTVALVHREAEASLLALQLLLAMTVQAVQRRGQTVLLQDSPRRMLLRIRANVTALLRLLGPGQFDEYQRMLEQVRSEQRCRISSKERQPWPRRKPHKPPKPPKIRVLEGALKRKFDRVLRAA